MELFLNWIRTDRLLFYLVRKNLRISQVNVGDIASLGLLNNDLYYKKAAFNENKSIMKNSRIHQQEQKLTGILSGYFSLMRLASACLLSVTNGKCIMGIQL